jgi:putative membrane protein
MEETKTIESGASTLRATFNPLVKPYMVLQIAFILVMTIVGIPLAIIWLLGVGQWWSRHYYEKLQCEISDIELKFRKGILFQVEKTIPLENIQDVTFIEGPILKRFHLSILKFETSGQSAGQAHDMQLVGIVDAHHFRQEILDRRRALRARGSDHQITAVSTGDSQLEVLRGIQTRLDEIAQLLKDRQS